MTTGLLTDTAERFPLGARNGIITPTAESISDSATTPFGLTLRAIPTPRSVVRVRSVDGLINMATEKLTSMSTDGSDEGDTRYDAENDS
ncbi:hypothetical protein B0I33_111170 [Prauserella shujinwangii]|uniref:Uncharacterized protein n=1 Tax=Prauserella shujinwangii TaxID=1453103 RepID=A0A2T0LN82_9PSEU|nr:hypothetical protein [Prauserella shujinwangii]PRX44657.1 hypothetical protein B0I33_111170 [Prauserella shujinwangii]